MLHERWNPASNQYEWVMGELNLRTHNGRITLTNPQGDHRTLWVKTMPDDSSFAPGQRMVAMLIKSDNDDWRSYRGFGFIREGKVVLWSKAKDSPIYVRLAALLNNLDEAASLGYKIRLEGRCRICNRVLTVPESIDKGIGPDCAARVEEKNSTWPVGLRAEDIQETMDAIEREHYAAGAD